MSAMPEFDVESEATFDARSSMHAPGESLNAIWVEWIVEMLSALGVRHAVLCPGGRASAMCLAFDAHPGVTVHMVCTDERSGAFVALGLAKASGEPVAIVTTSGSAIANVLPALTEADAANVPLVVLTCDRPRALRGAGFGQMADHLGATRAFVRAQADLADPVDSPDAIAEARDALASALMAMRDGVDEPEGRLLQIDAHPPARRPTRGPVHLNVPLAGAYDAVETQPVSFATVRAARDGDAHDHAASSQALAATEARRIESITSIVARVIERVRARRAHRPLDGGLNGLIVVGPEPGVSLDAIYSLAASTGFPVLADAGSGLRAAPQAIAPDAVARGKPGALIVNAFDVFGGAARLADTRAELIVRFGLAPVMPVLHAYLEQQVDVPAIKIAPHAVAHDYLHRGLDPRDVLVLAPQSSHEPQATAALDELGSALRHAVAAPQAVAFAWRDRWASAASYAARERRACVAALPWGEVAAVHRVLDARGFAFMHLGNSMSMRHADIGYDVRAERQDIYVNRGVSGIDGTLSTFLGEVLARRDPGLVLLGDQALVHDLSALASAQRIGSPACVCVVDNGGGAIFDFLPIAQADAYQRAIRNPYKFDSGALAQAFGLAHHRATSRETLDAALEAARVHAGVTVVEIAVEPFSAAMQMQRLAHTLEGV
ncbi:2-succinyl-5-enolpyruvyl-6-hydroxy-3-cyclohexene-1-carboxylate synthase [Paraburkholderia sp. GAS199]|uniref:2-succinyl-5-enolpyruvyl-6-hydroxy-3- cyclohexene-1-carboxylic-acid synthase n=1 Tax=Paraburkholderia sp. GAS199 TaxID=3035126 RepID=UPI003D21AB7B